MYSCRSTMTRQSHRIIILNLKKKNKYLISMFAKIYYNIEIWSDLYNKFLKNKLNHPHFLFTRIYCNKTLLSNSRIQNIFNGVLWWLTSLKKKRYKIFLILHIIKSNPNIVYMFNQKPAYQIQRKHSYSS